MSQTFDFHFHLLFKHYIKEGFKINQNVAMHGIAKLLNDLSGGPFDSQSSPTQVRNGPLKVGVVALISLEHAFANRVLQLFGIDFSPSLGLNKDVFRKTKMGETTYFDEFKKQIDFYR